MTTNQHQVNRTIIPANLPAKIVKVNIDGYTMNPIFLIEVMENDNVIFSYWTGESNIVFWREMKDFSEREKELIKAANLRAKQIRDYYDGKPVKIDSENPLKQFTELQK